MEMTQEREREKESKWSLKNEPHIILLNLSAAKMSEMSRQSFSHWLQGVLM